MYASFKQSSAAAATLPQALDVMKLLLALMLIMLSGNALACGCNKPTSVSQLRYPSIVFKGKVVSIVKHKRSDLFFEKDDQLFADLSSQVVTFVIKEQIQGPAMKRITVSFNEGGTSSCDLESLTFKKGDIYLISTLIPTADNMARAKVAKSTAYSNNYCNIRQHLTNQSR